MGSSAGRSILRRGPSWAGAPAWGFAAPRAAAAGPPPRRPPPRPAPPPPPPPPGGGGEPRPRGRRDARGGRGHLAQRPPDGRRWAPLCARPNRFLRELFRGPRALGLRRRRPERDRVLELHIPHPSPRPVSRKVRRGPRLPPADRPVDGRRRARAPGVAIPGLGLRRAVPRL